MLSCIFSSDRSRTCKKNCTYDLNQHSDSEYLMGRFKKMQKTKNKNFQTNKKDLFLPSVHKTIDQKKTRFVGEIVSGSSAHEEMYKINIRNIICSKGLGIRTTRRKRHVPYLNQKTYKFYQFVIEETSDEEDEEIPSRARSTIISPPDSIQNNKKAFIHNLCFIKV